MANTTLQQQHQPDAALFVLEPESSSPSPEAPAEQTSSLDVETQHKALGWGRPQVVSAASHRLKCVLHGASWLLYRGFAG